MTNVFLFLSILIFMVYTCFENFVEETTKYPFYEGRQYCDKLSDSKIVQLLFMVVVDRSLMCNIFLFPIVIVCFKSPQDIL